jgi:hypothetical protein
MGRIHSIPISLNLQFRNYYDVQSEIRNPKLKGPDPLILYPMPYALCPLRN